MDDGDLGFDFFLKKPGARKSFLILCLCLFHHSADILLSAEDIYPQNLQHFSIIPSCNHGLVTSPRGKYSMSDVALLLQLDAFQNLSFGWSLSLKDTQLSGKSRSSDSFPRLCSHHACLQRIHCHLEGVEMDAIQRLTDVHFGLEGCQHLFF